MKAREIMRYLMGTEITNDMVEYLELNFEDFADVRRKYLSAIDQLGNMQGEKTALSVHMLVDAIDQQITLSLLFSGLLGMKSNLDHFRNPIAKTVLDVDFDVFLRENTLHRLPEYEITQAIINRFFKMLSIEEHIVSDAIREYISYFETVGPKLAHFRGFDFGDQILQKIVPGYYPDKVLTNQYRVMLELYLGCNLEAYLDHDVEM